MSRLLLALSLPFALGACTRPTVDPVGRPCDDHTACGPGTTCDPRSSTCAPSAAFDATVHDRSTERRAVDLRHADVLGCPAGCRIGGTCFADQARNPAQSCQQCVVRISTAAWSPAPGCVTTIAGDGTSGSRNGPALSASFDGPRGLALASGKLYVADRENNVIRLVDGGQVVTLAGMGMPGLVNAPALGARFSMPNDVVVDGSGNVYVADRGNSVIRLIAGGQVSTFAGGAPGMTNGALAAARFDHANGLAMDSSGKIYVADVNNHAIRVISGGQVTTLAGTGTAGFLDGPASSAQFDAPNDVAVDGSGAVYVADYGNHRIRKIAGGQVSTVAGSGTTPGFADGPALSARFANPVGVAVGASGTIYVGDTFNYRVRVIAGGSVATLAGTGTAGYKDGPVAQAQFAEPGRLLVDSAGYVYVSDPANQRIRVIQP
jgi:sugar lactone lactonase YvrE